MVKKVKKSVNEKVNYLGITGAIVGAILFYFVSSLFAVIGINGSNFIGWIFALIGAISGYFAVSGNKSSYSFFTFTSKKLAWTVILGVLAYFSIFLFMDVQATTGWMGGLVNNLLVFYSWIFFLFSNLTLLLANLFIQIDNPSTLVYSLVVYGPFIVNLIWDYFLVCLVFYIINKIRGKN